MAVHFISGKPGGGKSLYSLRLIVYELVHGSRYIFTNIVIKLEALVAYLQENHPGRDWHHEVNHRVQMFLEQEAAEFWCYRPNGVHIARISNEEWKGSKGKKGEPEREPVRPDYSGVKDSGVLYVIDECHIFFNSRDFVDLGRDLIYYISQHRKLGDDIVFVSQAVLNVDTQLRRVAQDFTYLTNLNKQGYGVFSLPKVFTRRTYAHPIGPGGKADQESLEFGSFRLDVSGLAACYDTAAGVGIQGKMADTEEKRRGLDWRLGVAAAVALVLICGFVVPKLVARAFKTPFDAIAAHPQQVQQAAHVQSSPPAPTRSLPTPAARQGEAQKAVSTNVFWTGKFGLSNGSFMAFLSDGSRHFFPGDVRAWSDDQIKIGEIVYRVPPPGFDPSRFNH
jgi:hypothetical protein